jgi:hypothetical protein
VSLQGGIEFDNEDEDENDKEDQLFEYLVDFKDDAQTRPAESTLKYISTSQVSELLLQDLLKSEDAMVKCDQGVDPYFSLEKLQVDRRNLISFM